MHVSQLDIFMSEMTKWFDVHFATFKVFKTFSFVSKSDVFNAWT